MSYSGIQYLAPMLRKMSTALNKEHEDGEHQCRRQSITEEWQLRGDKIISVKRQRK